MKLARVLWPLGLVVLVALALALFTNVFGRQLIPGLPVIRLQRVERFATSSITLESVRELSSLSTVRYVHRAVFPYDYLPRDVSLNTILRKLRASDQTVRDTLTPQEYLYLQTWNLASDIQLGMTAGTFDFVVVSLVITAGFDVDTGDEQIRTQEYQMESGETGRRAIVRLAPVTITRTSVEDINRADYPYPDTSLSADAWRRVAGFVQEQSVPQSVRQEILETARRNGEKFLEGLLLQAGFTDVLVEYTG
jgi:hypothetical protein